MPNYGNSITKLVLFLFINIGKVLGGIFVTGKSKSIFKKNFIQEGPEELEYFFLIDNAVILYIKNLLSFRGKGKYKWF